MSKIEKKHLNIISVCAAVIVISCICIGILRCIDIGSKVEKVIKYICVILVISSYAVMILYVLVGLVFAWKKSIHNIRVCDNKIFDDLSKVYEIAHDDNDYENAYKLINYYYKDGGIVDDLIFDKQFVILLKRYDFLKKSIEVDNDLSQYVHSIFLSVFSTELSDISDEAYVLNSGLGFISFLVKMFIVIFALVFVFYLRYYKRGKNGKFGYVLMEYEIEKLREKLESSTYNEKMQKKDYEIIMMKYLLMHKILILDVKKHKKIKLEERKQDVKELGALDLTLEKYKNNIFKECVIDDIVIRFYYKVRNGKKVKSYKLVNKNYKRFYEIVKKYYDIKISDNIQM